MLQPSLFSVLRKYDQKLQGNINDIAKQNPEILKVMGGYELSEMSMDLLAKIDLTVYSFDDLIHCIKYTRERLTSDFYINLITTVDQDEYLTGVVVHRILSDRNNVQIVCDILNSEDIYEEDCYIFKQVVLHDQKVVKTIIKNKRYSLLKYYRDEPGDRLLRLVYSEMADYIINDMDIEYLSQIHKFFELVDIKILRPYLEGNDDLLNLYINSVRLDKPEFSQIENFKNFSQLLKRLANNVKYAHYIIYEKYKFNGFLTDQEIINLATDEFIVAVNVSRRDYVFDRVLSIKKIQEDFKDIIGDAIRYVDEPYSLADYFYYDVVPTLTTGKDYDYKWLVENHRDVVIEFLLNHVREEFLQVVDKLLAADRSLIEFVGYENYVKCRY